MKEWVLMMNGYSSSSAITSLSVCAIVILYRVLLEVEKVSLVHSEVSVYERQALLLENFSKLYVTKDHYT